MADIFNMADTWNDAGTTFAAIKMDVTDTASDAASLLLDLQVGGSSKFTVDKDGDVILGNNGVGRVITASEVKYPVGALTLRHAHTNDDVRIATNSVGTPVLGFYSHNTQHVQLHAPVANVLEQRRSTNAQTFNLYNTYTDASNYERVSMGWSGNVFSIAPGAAGTGSTRVIHISGLPTSNPGPGILWNNAGTPAIGT